MDLVLFQLKRSNFDRHHLVLRLRLLLRVHHRHCHRLTVPFQQVNLLDLMMERRVTLDVGRKTDWHDEMKDMHWLPNDEDSLEEIDSFCSNFKEKCFDSIHVERLVDLFLPR